MPTASPTPNKNLLRPYFLYQTTVPLDLTFSTMSGEHTVQPALVADRTLDVTSSSVQPTAAVTINSSLPATPSSATEGTPSPMMSEAEIREMRIREQYQSEKAYSHINTQSAVSDRVLPHLRCQYQIPDECELHAPNLSEWMYWRLKGEWVVVPIYVLKYGVRFPLHEFISFYLCFVLCPLICT